MAGCAALLVLSVFLCGCGSSIHDDTARGDLASIKAKVAADPSVLSSTTDIGKTALHYAVSYKQIPAMEFLAGAGADLNAKDITGMTPLHVAAMLGRKDEAVWLLEHGADVHARDQFGDTPLLTAAVFGSGGVVKALQDHGARLDEKNNDGHDAAALARINHQDKMATYLEKRMKSTT